MASSGFKKPKSYFYLKKLCLNCMSEKEYSFSSEITSFSFNKLFGCFRLHGIKNQVMKKEKGPWPLYYNSSHCFGRVCYVLHFFISVAVSFSPKY